MLATATEYPFKALLDSAPDAIVITGPDGIIELVNLQTELLFGYNRNELIGERIEILMPQRFREAHMPKRHAFIQNPAVRGMGNGLELFARRKNGSEFLVEIALSYIKHEGRTNACAAIRDITERKMLEKQTALLASIVETSNDAIISISLDNIVTSWNAGAERIFGYTRAEAIGKDIDFLTPKENRAAARRMINTALKGKTTFTKDTERLHKTGKRIPVSISLSLVKDTRGDIVGISIVIHDIAREKAAKKVITQLSRQKEDLEQKLIYHKQLEDFAYICSHNLRSPVGNLNALFLMYDKQADAEKKDMIVTKLRTVTAHLTNTLNVLSQALSIKTDMGVASTKLLFSNVLAKITESIETDITSTNTLITSDFSRLPQIAYPEMYLESIMLNFLTNAIKYRSPQRKPEIHFESRYTKAEGRVLTVRDNGVGIDLKRHRDKIFGLHKTFHRNEDARGIGLFITKAQVEAMGGSITVDSRVDKGSVFTVYFDLVSHS